MPAAAFARTYLVHTDRAFRRHLIGLSGLGCQAARKVTLLPQLASRPEAVGPARLRPDGMTGRLGE